MNLTKAILNENNFKFSSFKLVNLNSAQVNRADLSFSIFKSCILTDVSFQESNLCEVKFDDNFMAGSNFRGALLFGADLSKQKNIIQPNRTFFDVNGAFFNSKAIQLNSLEWEIVKKLEGTYRGGCSKLRKEIPPTKFPQNFNPIMHGMIDISIVDDINSLEPVPR